MIPDTRPAAAAILLIVLTIWAEPLTSTAQEGPTSAEASASKPPKEPSSPKLPELPSLEAAREAMKKASTFFRREVSFAGGYAWEWPEDLSTAESEGREGLTLITMQPPGTPSVGQAYLSAWQATGDPLHLQAAREAAHALLWCQLSTGGWDADFEFDPRKARRLHFRRDVEAGDTEPGGWHAKSSLDDGKTQSALSFLVELAHDPASREDAPLHKALRFGMDGLLAAQAPNGAWGQSLAGPADATAPVSGARIPAEWPRVWPGVPYDHFYTLNDGNLLGVMRLLLRVHELDGDARCLTAARKLGDFLLLAQFPEPQPGWAQQYNRDMEPVWARKFEPPAISSIESFGALETLAELWAATGDERYLQPVKPALAWLRRSRLPDGQWARFYELGTNQPLYCKRDSYELTHDATDLPTHYGFLIGESLASKLDALETRLAKGREAWKAAEAPPSSPEEWAKQARERRSKVRDALTALDRKGRWLDPGTKRITSRLFVRHLQNLARYVDAGSKGGAAFEQMVSEAAGQFEKQQREAAEKAEAKAKEAASSKTGEGKQDKPKP